MVTVLFTCHACGLIKAKAFIRDRGKNEDIAVWMDEAAKQAGTVHSLLSRHCKERKIDMYIPFTEERGVGSGELPPGLATDLSS